MLTGQQSSTTPSLANTQQCSGPQIPPPSTGEVSFDLRHEDVEEARKISTFLADGCKCELNCFDYFSRAHYELVRSQCAELNHKTLDMVVMGQLMAFTADNSSHSQYMHKGREICRVTFQFLHGIGKHRLYAIKSSLRMNGLEAREHGNAHKLPHNAFSVDDERRVVSFIENYVEDHGILLPGRIPGYNRTDLKLLPSSVTKLAIWEMYREAVTSEGGRIAGYRSFRLIWQKYLLQVLITKPMFDLCFTCQKNNTHILRSANKSEWEKSTVQLIKSLLTKIYKIFLLPSTESEDC